VALVSGHGHMRCIDGTVDPVTHTVATCAAGIRNEGIELVSPIENYKYNREPNLPMCQSTARGVGPAQLAAYYGDGTNGKAKMGSMVPGQNFQVIWYARTHAQAKEQPRDIAIYMSPRPVAAGQTEDFSLQDMLTNKICQGPYVNCGAGLYVWMPTANNISCTMSCAIPTTNPDGTKLTSGVYTILWRWDWPAPNRVQHTCGDVTITADPTVTYQQRNLLGVTGSCSDSSYCANICGAENVTSCSCNTQNGWLTKVCNNDRYGSSNMIVPMFALLASLFFLV